MKMIKHFALVVGLSIASVTLSAPTAKAQIKVDSTTNINKTVTVFTGSEKDLADSLGAIVKALDDPALKATVGEAITKVTTLPKSGSDVGTWISYILGALGLAFGLYHFITSKLSLKTIAANIEQHLGVIASAPPTTVTHIVDGSLAKAPTDDPVADQPAPDPVAQPVAQSEAAKILGDPSDAKQGAITITPDGKGGFTISAV